MLTHQLIVDNKYTKCRPKMRMEGKMINIKKHVQMLDPKLLAAFRLQPAATIHEAMGRKGALDPLIKPINRSMKICGQALTVSCHTGDNLMLIKAISMARTGDVIIADMGAAVDSGPFGEVLAVECVTRGVEGLVVSCAVRDSLEIEKLGFPVFSNGLCIKGTAKATLGTINHSISCGGQIICPGDIIIGDADGVVVVPRNDAVDVLKAAQERTEKEEIVMNRLRSGESLFDIYGYQKTMDALHCIEE